MGSYSFWNNKGGVGKSFLVFATSCEYANQHPNEKILVLDLCPQANLTEILLGGKDLSSKALDEFYNETPRKSVGGYFESRLSSPFIPLKNISNFIVNPHKHNKNIPKNVVLLPGDNLLELLSEAIRQAAQMSVPVDAWSKIMRWLCDFVDSYRDETNSDVTVFVDCNPSFSIYNQIGLCASSSLVIPFTADDSSRRGVENIFALLYGIASSKLAPYARLSFSKKANDEGLVLPKIHSVVSNMVTMYKGKPSNAWSAKSGQITELISELKIQNQHVFFAKDNLYFDVPDHHAAAVVSSTEGCPISLLKPGPHEIEGRVVQINKKPLEKYIAAIKKLVETM